MLDEFPSLKMYFNAIDIYVLGDLLVFDKNCRLADKADNYYNTTLSGISLNKINPNLEISYSTIYPINTGSNPSAAYVENPNPRLTIPLAMMLFSIMELLGIFYTGKTTPGSTRNNLKTFFDKLDLENKPREDEFEILIEIYRHGLVHQYFPKKRYTLSYSFINQNFLFDPTNPMCLNVNYLKQLLLKGYEIIKNDKDNFRIMDTNLTKIYSIT